MANRGSRWPIVARVLCALAALASATQSLALDVGDFSAAALKGDGWSASDVRVQLGLAADGSLSGELRAAELKLPDLQIAVRNARMTCQRLQLTASTISCEQALLSSQGLPLDSPDFAASFKYNLVSGDIQLTLPALRLAGGTMRVDLRLSEQIWRAKVDLRSASLTGLGRASATWLELPLPAGVEGKLDAQVTFASGKQAATAEGSARVYAVSGSNPAGTLASDQLGAKFAFSARLQQATWTASIQIGETRGQVYALPVFVDFANNPLSAQLEITLPGEGNGHINFKATQSGVGSFAGELGIDPSRGFVRKLNLTEGHAELPGAYEVYLQPFLVGTTADSLETEGYIEVGVDYADGSLSEFTLNLHEIYMDDRRGRFALYAVQGVIDWGVDAPRPSTLTWEGGYLYKLGLGKASLPLLTGGGEIGLQERVLIPVLDGRLAISRFQLTHEGSALRDLEFEADIEAIGLRALTRALGWPPFAGNLSGHIPRMRLADNAITVAGALSAKVFDGEISLANLRIQEPFGVLPQVDADVTIRGLDLAALSSTFSFGSMEGRLDGDFNKLRMLGFSPVSFDARLYTPAGDRSRHRISQQAIENISDLGGVGAAAVLSRGFLRFFDAFAYDEIGWSCRLEDEICTMNGVSPAPQNGYYIVKGKGLPRINVIGYSRRVSWPALVEKLRNINASGAAVVR